MSSIQNAGNYQCLHLGLTFLSFLAIVLPVPQSLPVHGDGLWMTVLWHEYLVTLSLGEEKGLGFGMFEVGQGQDVRN
jgi:hypothetical protein